MTCQACAYQFAFDPHRDRLQGRRLSDGAMQSILYAASAGHTLFYTANQLYIFACAKQRYRWRKRHGWLAVLNPLLQLVGKRAHLLRQPWDACLAQWERAGKALPGLLREPTLHEPPPAWDEPDIYDYGALGILLCQHDQHVDWFVLNKLPAELKLVVLSESGYPAYLQPIVARLLQENPHLPLYGLHDASSAGRQLLSRLHARGQLPLANHPVFSLGIGLNEMKHLPGRPLLPSAPSSEHLAIDTIPYRHLVDLMAEAIAANPPQSLASVWQARQMRKNDSEYMIDSDFG